MPERHPGNPREDPGARSPEFDLHAALQKFAPEVRLHPDDRQRPASVAWYLGRTRLMQRRGLLRRDRELLPPGGVTPETLAGGAWVGAGPGGDGLYLQIVGGPGHARARTRLGQPLEGGRASAECYAHARLANRDPGAYDAQYWFFYPFNGRQGRHVTHEGDWEHVTVRLSNRPEPELIGVYYSAHGLVSGRWLRAGGEIPLNSAGRPIVYSALGSHASYPTAGAHPRGRVKSADLTADDGPVWDTGQDVVLAGLEGLPAAGHEWLNYPGRWGAIRRWSWPFATSGPPGPMHQVSWLHTPPFQATDGPAGR